MERNRSTTINIFQVKNEKKRKEPGLYSGEREKNGVREREGAKRQCVIKSSFIHTVSSNYQGICSIP